jgi:hypothetical protein
MTTQSQSQHKPQFQVIKGGKYNHYKKRSRKKRRDKQNKLFWADACVKTLQAMQQASRFINAAFHKDRYTPGYEMLQSWLIEQSDTKSKSISLIEKEIILYDHFSKVPPLAFYAYGKALEQGEEQYRIIVKIREEEDLDHELHLRILARRIMLYVITPEYKLSIRIKETLSAFGHKPLTRLFHHMSVHLHFNS